MTDPEYKSRYAHLTVSKWACYLAAGFYYFCVGMYMRQLPAMAEGPLFLVPDDLSAAQATILILSTFCSGLGILLSAAGLNFDYLRENLKPQGR
jgi:hypothetical protein